METKDIITSIKYLDFINSLDKIINDLLYSKENGYIYLSAKNTVEKFEETIEKFNQRSAKLKNNSIFSNMDDLIEKKKTIFIKKLNKYKKEQIPIWASEVFDDFIENCFLNLSLDKTQIHKIFEDMVNAIKWYANIKELSKAQYESMMNLFSEKFKNIANSKEKDFIKEEKIVSTNPKRFMEIWYFLLKNQNDFINFNLENETNSLDKEDMNYFENIKKALLNYTNTSLIDEINLINTALEILNLKEDEEKYIFIKDLNNDFISQKNLNSKLTEDDKIKLTKRRIELYNDRFNNYSKYYRKKLSSLSE